MRDESTAEAFGMTGGSGTAEGYGMAGDATEEETEAAAAGYEDLGPDYEYMMAQARCCCQCH